MSDAQALAERVAGRQWFHRIDLGHGIVTPGQDDTPLKLGGLGLPEDLTGKSVVDIGAWDGFFAFECERRGATVLATDHHCWTREGFQDKGGFDLAKRALGSQVQERVVSVEDLPTADLGRFDIVLFLGVLYHARDPLGYLTNIRAITKGMAIIETYVDLLEISRPAIAYYPGTTLNNDPTSFFGPNEAAVHGLCQDAGFSRVETIKPSYAPDRMVFHAFA